MSVEGSEFMIMLLGWIMFLLTLQIAIWRDVVRENLAETRAKEDLEFLRNKQAEWQAERHSMRLQIEHQTEVNQQFASMLENARRAVSRFAK